MTTSTTSTPVSNASSTTFRLWGLENNVALTAIGLTQTADTGQINWATVALPGAGNTQAGFEIWRFNDTLQSTSPVFLKIDYGTGSSTAVPMIGLTIGQGSNGSGTLTGTLSTRVAETAQGGISSTITNATSFWCYNATAGFLGVGWKYGVNSGLVAANTALGGFTLERSCDTTGTSTADAVLLQTPVPNTTGGASTGGVGQVYSYLTSAFPLGAAGTASGSWGALWPYNVTTTTISGNQQVMPRFLFTPNIQLSNCSGIGLSGDIPFGNTFTAALIGATTRTYLSTGLGKGSAAVAVQSGAPGSLVEYMLWQ